MVNSQIKRHEHLCIFRRQQKQQQQKHNYLYLLFLLLFYLGKIFNEIIHNEIYFFLLIIHTL